MRLQVSTNFTQLTVIEPHSVLTADIYHRVAIEHVKMALHPLPATRAENQLFE